MVSGPEARIPIVFLHGFLGDHRDWDLTIANLSGHRCIAIDLPGAGQSEALSPGCDGFSVTRMALMECLRAMDIHRAHWVGYSMGARLALDLAIHHPKRVESLTMISGSPGLKDKEDRSERVDWEDDWARRFNHHPMRETVTDWYAQSLFDSFRNCAQFASVMERRTTQDPDQMARTLLLLGAGAQPSVWDRLSTLKAPLTIITGKSDMKYSKIAKEMLALNPNFKHHAMPTGHCVHLESDALMLTFG